MPKHIARAWCPTTLLAVCVLTSGCARYTTPGGRADLGIFADNEIRTILERRPVCPMPAHLAVVRVQEPNYSSRSARGLGQGRFSVVTARDVEQEEDFEQLAALPEIAQVAPLNRLLLNDQLDSDEQLRQGAAALRADVILIYTFDTAVFVGDALKPLSVVTLGFSPHKDIQVTTTASSVLLDVRTGYVYGACETNARRTRLASTWTTADTLDRSRLTTEREAFKELLSEFEKLWSDVCRARKVAMAHP